VSRTQAGTAAGLSIRAPDDSDAAALAELTAAEERAADGRAETTEGDIRFIWGWPRFDRGRDAWVALREEVPTGYAWVWGPHRPRPDYDGRLQLRRPDFPTGAAAELLDRMEKRTLERWSEDGFDERPCLAIPCSAKDDSKRGLLVSRGYRPMRMFFRMDRGLEAPFGAPAWPIGARVSAFRPGADEPAVHQVMQESFADHFRFTPESLEDWSRRALHHPDFAPELTFLVWLDGQPIAASLNYRFGDEGWVGMLGTRRAWRRRGLGTALLLHSFAAFREAGCGTAALGVDAENADGAVALYERVGMVVTRRDELFMRELPA
jgi:GNAT superfamily N-acetyltransferase